MDTHVPCPEENVIVEFARASLPAEQRAEIQAHIEGCDACSEVVAALARSFESLFEEAVVSDDAAITVAGEGVADHRGPGLSPGDHVGRYRIVRRIGAGGMGIVYVAHDPQLDREIAIKVLRGISEEAGSVQSTEGQRRLLREAQTMAKLSHANVVSVHDVGVIDDRVFIAMEYIRGQTLGSWLREATRDWREILRVFDAAGTGLAAAHGAGLVHRDFKPDNVMIAADGQVRVMDFGLARAASVHDESLVTVESLGLSNPGADPIALTRTGAVVGTPAYMAPEQHQAGETGPATDQFSFCVALHEALYGARPFVGDTVAALTLSVLGNERRPVTDDRGVPGWVRAAVERGLAIEPDDRHPSMDALLGALRADPSARRRRWGWAAAVAVAAIVPTTAVLLDDGPACNRGSAEIADAWDGRRQDVSQRFTEASEALGATTFDRVAARLDSYAGQWATMRDEACRAAADGSQSEGLYDRRLACLDQRRRTLAAIVDIFVDADGEVVQRAVGAAGSLAPIERCADIKGLSDGVLLPDDPDLHAAVGEVRDAVAEAAALNVAGRYDDGLRVAEAAVVAAEAVGFKPAIAEAQRVMGSAAQGAGKFEQAEQALTDAYWLAAKTKHERIAAISAAELMLVLGHDLARPDDAALWEKQAEAALERFGLGGEEEAEFYNRRATITVDRGDYALARTHAEKALALHRAASESMSANAGLVLSNLGGIAIKQGQFDAARDYLIEAKDALTESLGPDHPKTGTATMNLGAAYYKLGDLERAEEFYRAAAGKAARSMGEDHVRVGDINSNLGSLLRAKGKYEEAETALTRAMKIYDGALPPDHPRVNHLRNSLGNLAYTRGDYPTARKWFSEALRGQEATVGPDHPSVGSTRMNLGNVATMEGELAAAEKHYADSIRIRETALGDDHPSVALSANNLAGVLLQLQRFEEAGALYERVLKIRRAKLPEGHRSLASTYAGLAMCEIGRGRYDEAIAMARKAESTYDDYADVGDQAQIWYTIGRALLLRGRPEDRADGMARVERAEAALRGNLPALQQPLDQLLSWKRDRPEWK